MCHRRTAVDRRCASAFQVVVIPENNPEKKKKEPLPTPLTTSPNQLLSRQGYAIGHHKSHHHHGGGGCCNSCGGCGKKRRSIEAFLEDPKIRETYKEV